MNDSPETEIMNRDANRNRDSSDEEEDRRENKSKKPRGDPPHSSLEREELPLFIFLLQMYFKGNFGNPPRVFTGASKKSGKSVRPLKPDRELFAKVHTWGESWKTDRCPFVHCVVRMRSKAKAQHNEFGRSHWLLFIDALGRHLQASQLQSQNKDSDDDSEEY
jgi:hypothetical protein